MKEIVISLPKKETMKILDFLEKEVQINAIIYTQCINCDEFKIYIPQNKVGDLLLKLSNIGCGVSYGLVTVSDVETIKPIPKETNNLSYEMSGTSSIEQVYASIVANVHFTNDYIMFCILSAILATIGLVSNNNAIIVASMLLSPIMGPLLGFTLGVVIQDEFLIRRSLKTEAFGLLIIFCTSFLVGLPFSEFDDDLEWPTDEMLNRGRPRDVVLGLLFAIPSGIAVGLSITNSGVNKFVGVAVAASLVPVLCNAGILFGYAMMDKIHLVPVTNDDFAMMGVYSFVIFVTNVIVITGAGMIIFRIKYGRGTIRRTSTTWKFPGLGKYREKVERFTQDSIDITKFFDIDDIEKLVPKKITEYDERKKTRSEAEIKEMLKSNLWAKTVLYRFVKYWADMNRQRKLINELNLERDFDSAIIEIEGLKKEI